jgi:diguanylate cyclase (GGDEF)-like protein/hemerythrin-like metal-binding protein
MNAPENRVTWLADSTVHDLIRRFSLPIALLDDAGEVLILNESFERSYGSEALGSAPLRKLIRSPIPDWQPVRLRSRSRGKVDVKAQVLRVQRNPMLIINDAADPGLLRELDQLHGQVMELERLSATDFLTGAWNRAHLDRVIASELDRSIRFKQPVSLILFDIDHFKHINDTYGHPAGDSVLREIVQVVRGSIRSIDTLYRWGGEEFVAVASATGYRQGAVLAEKLRRKVEEHRFAGVGSVTVSVGVAEHLVGESAENWFRRADEMLYQAKETARNRVCVDRRGSSDAWVAETSPAALRLVWLEGYECGEPRIDSEHRRLFELGNALLDASFSADSSPQDFNAALGELMACIVRHFAEEEELLAERGYEDLELHRQLHARLLSRVEELKVSITAGKTRLGSLVEFLANTLIAQHLFRADRQYFPLFQKPSAPGGV